MVCFLPEDPALPHTCTLHVYVLLFRYLTSLYLCAFFENGSSNDNDGLSLFGDCNCSYFDANSFKIMNSNSSSCEFSVCYLNAKSLCKNFFVIQFHLLYDQQFGFRASYSTYMALIQLVDSLSISLSDKQSSIGVFIDLSKAFDTINHTFISCFIAKRSETALVFVNFFIIFFLFVCFSTHNFLHSS